MIGAKRSAVIRLLINDAVEASQGSYPDATCLLSEAVNSLILSRHQGHAAVEIAVMFAGVMVDHVKTYSGFPAIAVAEAVATGDPYAIGLADNRESDRLGTFLAGGTPFDDDGELTEPGRDRGSREEWEYSAHGYCMAALCGTQGGTKGGKVDVSAAALGLLLGLTERMGVKAGVILAPGDAS